MFSILIGTTSKGKNKLPIGSLFFPLKVANFKMCFIYVEAYFTVQKKGVFMDINILRVCVHLLLIV